MIAPGLEIFKLCRECLVGVGLDERECWICGNRDLRTGTAILHPGVLIEDIL